jgi:hypothetical protein
MVTWSTATIAAFAAAAGLAVIAPQALNPTVLKKADRATVGCQTLRAADGATLCVSFGASNAAETKTIEIRTEPGVSTLMRVPVGE